MKTLFYVLFAVSASLSVAAAETPATVEFPEHEFSIAPLEGKDDSKIVNALMMFLPPVDGFSANVNVQVHPHKGSIEDQWKGIRGG